MPVDKGIELPKVQTLLKIPVDDIIFHSAESKVQIISAGVSIGKIEYIDTAKGIQYITDKKNVNWLNWNTVFQKYKNSIEEKIYDKTKLDRNKTIVQGSTWRSGLVAEYNYATDYKGDTLYSFECSYDGTDWDVDLTKNPNRFP
jgi:hypothetical protein